PATHGVLRLKVTLEGEVVRDCEAVMGYLHRGVEKLFEDGSYLQAIPMTDRLDYLAAMHNNYALCYGVEKMMGANVPEKAQYIRALTTEVQRVASHLLWLGAFSLDLGAITPFWWCVRGREGDNYARFVCRIEEMKQSLDMLDQMIAQCPEKGEYIAPEIGEGPRQHRVKPPKGDVYAGIERARGEYGVYIVSDGTNRPYRLKWRAPTLANLHPLGDMTRGAKIPDLIVTLGSIDIVL